MQSFKPFENFLRQVATFPERPALFCRGEFYSYGQVWRVAAAVRDALVKAGSPARVGLFTGDDFYTYAAIFGVWAAGGAYVPLNQKNPPTRNAAICRQAELNMVLSAEDENEMDLPEITTVVVNKLPQAEFPSFEVKETPLQNPAYLFFTSGSTGTPKGVPISRAALTAFCNAISSHYSFSFTDKFLQPFELTFDLSVFSFLAPLSVGACCYVLEEDGTPVYLRCADYLETHGLTVALMAPSVLRYLKNFFDELSFPDLKYSFFCGEALPQDLALSWAKLCPNAVVENVYGPTEATIFCLRYAFDPENDESHNGVVPIGTPLTGVETLVWDAETGVCPLETQGELLVAGAQLTDSYISAPEKNAQAFIELEGKRYYRTGDRVFCRTDGVYIFCGRIDEQLKIDGFRVEPGEIEFHLRAFFQKEVVVFALDAATLVAVVETEQTPDRAIVEAYLRDKLPPYMIPRAYYALPVFPLNLNGKTDRPEIQRRVKAK